MTLPTYMIETVFGFNKKAEHIGEFVAMLIISTVLALYSLAPLQW